MDTLLRLFPFIFSRKSYRFTRKLNSWFSFVFSSNFVPLSVFRLLFPLDLCRSHSYFLSLSLSFDVLYIYSPIRKHEYRSVEPRETSDRVQSSRIRPASARPSTGKPNTLRDRPSSADGFGPRPSWIPDPYSKSVDPKPSRFKSSRGGECFDSNPFGLKKSTPEKTVGTLDGGRDVKQSERDRSTLSRSRPRSAPIQRSTYRVRLHDTFSPTPEYIPSPYRDNPLACASLSPHFFLFSICFFPSLSPLSFFSLVFFLIFTFFVSHFWGCSSTPLYFIQ